MPVVDDGLAIAAVPAVHYRAGETQWMMEGVQNWMVLVKVVRASTFTIQCTHRERETHARCNDSHCAALWSRPPLKTRWSTGSPSGS